MKKSAILSFTILFTFFAVTAQAQKEVKAQHTSGVKSERTALKKLEGTSVNPVAKRNFESDFANTSDVQWTRSTNFDEATFTRNNEKVTAYYDSDGYLVGSTIPKKFSDIPEKGQKAIKEKYKDYKIGPVILYDDSETNKTDMILWATQFDDEDLYFVELTKGTDHIVVQSNLLGQISFFKKL